MTQRGLAAGCGDLGGERLGCLGAAAIVDDDGIAGAASARGDGGADAVGGAGDEGDAGMGE